jgi:choline-sulfatase
MADQLRSTALEMYRPNTCATPSLERLAAQGVRYEHAITPHPLCVPARTAIMTGRYPHSTGARRNETLMPAEANHAFRIWNGEGFKTGLIGKNHCFELEEDIALLDVYCEITHKGRSDLADSPKGMEWVRPVGAIDTAAEARDEIPRQSPRIAYRVTDGPEEDYGTAVITAQSVRFLEESHEEPFALWVSFPDPHEPYEVPRRYAEMFPPESIELPPWPEDEFAPERNRVLKRMLDISQDDEADVRGIISTYYAMTRFVDDGVGQILDALERLNLADNTIVVFTADHGDFMGEHGMVVKGGVFYDSLTRVPLIVSYPGVVPANQVDSSMVNTIDIIPTLLQLQGIDAPPEMDGEPLPTATDASPRDEAFSEYGTGGPQYTMADLEKIPEPYGYPTLLQNLWAREAEGRRKMVRTTQWKYVHDPMGDLDELYDLVNDPWETRNVAADPSNASVVSEMRLRLADWMIRTEDAVPVPLPDQIGHPTYR